jgi:hypothetical protein
MSLKIVLMALIKSGCIQIRINTVVLIVTIALVRRATHGETECVI